jgi:dUTP pyrophosphatase
MSAQAIDIPILACNDEALFPVRIHEGDAGYDLCAVCELVLKPFERAMIPTGLCVAIPHGYAGLVLPRSGLAIKQGLSLVNSPGLIDSNYRGEIHVIAINLDPQNSLTVRKYDRIAQLVVVRVEELTFSVAESLEVTDRGTEGFGSTGSSGVLLPRTGEA